MPRACLRSGRGGGGLLGGLARGSLMQIKVELIARVFSDASRVSVISNVAMTTSIIFHDKWTKRGADDRWRAENRARDRQNGGGGAAAAAGREVKSIVIAYSILDAGFSVKDSSHADRVDRSDDEQWFARPFPFDRRNNLLARDRIGDTTRHVTSSHEMARVCVLDVDAETRIN